MEIIKADALNKKRLFYSGRIKRGAVFIYPTDTIYGIGCNALISPSVERIRRLKKRPKIPFSVIAPSKKWILKHCAVKDTKVLSKIPLVQVNGDRQNRLPNTSNLAFEHVDQEALLILLDEAGVLASAGSACFSGSPEPSHVLRGMGFSEARARSSVRFSFGPENTREEVGVAVELLNGFVGRLRKIEWEDPHPHSVVK